MPAMSAVPLQITLRRAARALEVAFDDGRTFSLPFEYLRVHSPSAEVQNHGGPTVLVLGKEQVQLLRVEPVGNYAVRLVFDDGHDSGLYTWKTLHELGSEHAERWAHYSKRRQQAQQGAQ